MISNEESHGQSRDSTAPTAGRVIVTGAGSGVGRATALALTRAGSGVACLDLNQAAAEATAGQARDVAAGQGSVSAHQADVTDPDSLAAAVRAAVAELGGLDALVNCAGIAGTTNIATTEVDLADFDRVVAVNLRGALIQSQAVLPIMLEAGYGRILHVASIAGKEGNAGMIAYSASKAGIIGMIKSMGKEYAQSGVTINALAPAVIQTPMVDALPEEQVRYMTDKIPMRRTATLAEVTAMILFAISPATSFVTAFTWDLSGGRATY